MELENTTKNRSFWKNLAIIIIFLLVLLIGESGIIFYCFADRGGDLDGRPLNPGYSEYIASVMTSSSPTGQYPYGDHRWTSAEGQAFVIQVYFRAVGIALIASLIYLAALISIILLLRK